MHSLGPEMGRVFPLGLQTCASITGGTKLTNAQTYAQRT